jgi:hypothetical protein
MNAKRKYQRLAPSIWAKICAEWETGDVTLPELSDRFGVNTRTLQTHFAPIIRENISRESRLMTDESNIYPEVGADFASHETVNHRREEYVRGDITTNTVEGYYSIFKRGMKGVYQHCSEKHLHRYLAEFDFRYSNRSALGIEDRERADILASGIVGKRLTYRRPHGEAQE